MTSSRVGERGRKRGSDSAPERIIRTAESLFAQRSIDGVSMREIALAADCANNNVVQYHFGTKDGLLDAIFSSRVQQMEPLRLRMLRLAEENGLLGDAAALLGILFLPHLELIDDDGRYPYAGFLLQFATRVWSRDRQRWSGSVKDARGLIGVMEHLHQLVDEPSSQLRSLRIMLCNMMFISTLVRWDNDSEADRQCLPLPARIRDVLHSSATTLTSEPPPGVGFPATAVEWEAGLGTSDGQ
ncbi:MAG TPA: helix-turn-helix domain-containing protein [Chiayiivirga sp.]|nr:helix-turn-helix domain-containing protein [Chiayiivirga sp.]